MNSRVVIPLSKKKIVALLVTSLVFLGLFIMILFLPLEPEKTRFAPLFMRVISIIGILLSGLAFVYGIRKLTDKSMGLIIDEHGIFDNSSGVSSGLIRWSDITSIETSRMFSSDFMLIYVSNPKCYIDKNKGVKKLIQLANHKMCDTPLSISTNNLQCSFEELENTMEECLKTYMPTQMQH